MRFAASLEPCSSCDTREQDELSFRGSGDTWFFTGNCPSCGTLRNFEFMSFGGDPGDETSSLHELGAGASELITTPQFLDEAKRVMAALPGDPKQLDSGVWQAGIKQLDRALTCFAEAEKQGGSCSSITSWAGRSWARSSGRQRGSPTSI
jgi:hypothetical protein